LVLPSTQQPPDGLEQQLHDAAIDMAMTVAIGIGLFRSAPARNSWLA
jgi:hypothetical protein